MSLFKKITDFLSPDWESRCDDSEGKPNPLTSTPVKRKPFRYTIDTTHPESDAMLVVNDLIHAEYRTHREVEEALLRFRPKNIEDINVLIKALEVVTDWRFANMILSCLQQASLGWPRIFKAFRNACCKHPEVAQRWGKMSLEDFFAIDAGEDRDEHRKSVDPYQQARELHEQALEQMNSKEKKTNPKLGPYYYEEGVKRHNGWTRSYMETSIVYEADPVSAAEYFVMSYRNEYPEAEPYVRKYLSVLREKYYVEAVALLKERTGCSDREIEDILQQSREHIENMQSKDEKSS